MHKQATPVHLPRQDYGCEMTQHMIPFPPAQQQTTYGGQHMAIAQRLYCTAAAAAWAPRTPAPSHRQRRRHACMLLTMPMQSVAHNQRHWCGLNNTPNANRLNHSIYMPPRHCPCNDCCRHCLASCCRCGRGRAGGMHACGRRARCVVNYCSAAGCRQGQLAYFPKHALHVCGMPYMLQCIAATAAAGGTVRCAGRVFRRRAAQLRLRRCAAACHATVVASSATCMLRPAP